MKKLIITLAILGLAFPASAIDTVKKATVFNPITKHRKVVVVGDPHAFDNGYLLEVARVVNKLPNGMLGYSVATSYSTTLSASINSTQATIPVSSMALKDGHTLVMGDLGSKVFLVIEPGASKEEIIVCTGISSTNWTGCTRGLAFYGTSTASITANRHAHNSGAKVIMSNTHYVYDELMDNDSSESIGGNKRFTGTTTFDGLPSLTTYIAPTADGDLAAKKYVDDTAVAGAPAATTGTAGIGKLATKSQAALGTSGDGTYNYFLPSSMATSTSQVATSSLVVTKSNGKIDPTFLNGTSEQYTINASTTFSATTTITGNAYFTNAYGAGFTHVEVKTSSGTWTVPSGVKKIRVRMVGGGGAGGTNTDASTQGVIYAGGGGGGYAEEIIDVSATTTIGYVIGSGGTSGATGGTTYFSSYCYATGGVAGGSSGVNSSIHGPAGGMGYGGDFNTSGQPGGSTAYFSSRALSGAGGHSLLGAGGQANSSGVTNETANGTAATGYGGGGGGNIDLYNSAGSTSGSGYAGVIIIEY